MKCWGKGDYGEMGIGTNSDTNMPVDVLNVTDAASIAAGCKHICVASNAGGVQCWGWNDQGQIGNGNNTNQTTPVSVMNITNNALWISAGFHSSCAATANGALCWGDDMPKASSVTGSKRRRASRSTCRSCNLRRS